MRVDLEGKVDMGASVSIQVAGELLAEAALQVLDRDCRSQCRMQERHGSDA